MFYQLSSGKLILFLHVQPGAKQSEFAGLHGERLKIRIKAAATDGKANAELLRFLAEKLSLSQSQITLCSGESSRQKKIEITGVGELPAILAAFQN
jgi:uncharacterized protein (TIGR00251 family)